MDKARRRRINPKPIGPFLLIVGVVALIGCWMIKEPTVEKVHMVTGAVVFLFLYLITLIAGLHNEVLRLRSQVDGLLDRELEAMGDDTIMES